MADLTTDITQALNKLSQTLIARGWLLSAAESCTGGMLSEHITAIAGSSAWFDCGFISYSNQSKTQLLAVNQNIIETHGAVSEEVAIEMAQGALANSQSHLSVAITGIAGPSGGTAAKPVGTVCFAWSSQITATSSQTYHFNGDRHAVRQQAVLAAIQGLNALISRATN